MNTKRDIRQAALDLFEGDEASTNRWLRTPAKALGGHTPNEVLEVEGGVEAVRDLIGRIEHGIVT